MSRHFTPWTGSLFVALTAAASLFSSAAYGQKPPINVPLPTHRAIRQVPPVVNPEPTEPDLFQPLVDPLTFRSDWQVFSPPDLSTYGGAEPPPTGFYFAYGREYVNMSRPEQTTVGGDPFARPFDGDWLWGNRYDMGYMTEDNHGWNITYSHITTGLQIDDADIGLQLKSRYHNLELSKTFRRGLRYGGFLEPYFGVRYIYFSDNEFDNSPVGLGAIDEFHQKMQNQMIGGQIGCRYRVRKGRWNITSDFKVFAGENFQFASVEDLDTQLGVSRVNASFDEFTPIGEFRLEAAYEIVRDLKLKVGMGVVHIVRGVLRADTAPFESNPNNPNLNPNNTLVLVNDQDLTVVGATFGIEYNR